PLVVHKISDNRRGRIATPIPVPNEINIGTSRHYWPAMIGNPIASRYPTRLHLAKMRIEFVHDFAMFFYSIYLLVAITRGVVGRRIGGKNRGSGHNSAGETEQQGLFHKGETSRFESKSEMKRLYHVHQVLETVIRLFIISNGLLMSIRISTDSARTPAQLIQLQLIRDPDQMLLPELRPIRGEAPHPGPCRSLS